MKKYYSFLLVCAGSTVVASHTPKKKKPVRPEIGYETRIQLFSGVRTTPAKPGAYRGTYITVLTAPRIRKKMMGGAAVYNASEWRLVSGLD